MCRGREGQGNRAGTERREVVRERSRIPFVKVRVHISVGKAGTALGGKEKPLEWKLREPQSLDRLNTIDDSLKEKTALPRVEMQLHQ